MANTMIVIGSLFALTGVALGAFGAHGLREKLTADMMAVYQTAVLYHLIHAIAIVAVGLAGHWLASKPLIQWSGYLFIAGILLFSGSLYILSISGIRALGMITPLGGLAFIGGWLLLAIGAWKG